jgi:hypothetical protein
MDNLNGSISYVLIYNPYQVVRKHIEKEDINAAVNAAKQRMIEIGAQDVVEPEEDEKGLKVAKPKPSAEILNKATKGKKAAA